MAFLQTDSPGFTDNEVLDEWRIPFGDWYDQSVDWIDNELGWLLDAIDGIFTGLIDFVNGTVLLGPPWFIVILAFFLLGWMLQNVRVGIFSATALMICALLGTDYWTETAKTIGFIAVAVLLCTIIGIPIGIMAGRVDSFWNAVRPVLDAMQVVHSFVYMLPFIYFFGIGEVSATIVTMVFALPPLIRLTNLGIRQVPEDVVEASRAFGQTEIAILRDVQLPLARPAIMTGINQTLLLSISMLGIAAIMGAGGLAQFMFRALSNQDPALSGSAGLSFFLVAVVLDRMTQRDGDTTRSLGSRIRRAWMARKTPEDLLEDEAETKVDDLPETASSHVVYEPVTSHERTGIAIAVAGSVVTIVSLLLTWNSGGGWYSSFTRRVDELGQVPAAGINAAKDITGDSFNGVSASGGSWFGFMLLAAAVMVIAAAVAVLRSPGGNSRWLSADGALVAALTAGVIAVVYVLGSPSPRAVADRGIGPFVALIGTLAMVVGAFWWMRAARHEPLRPLSDRIVPSVVMAGIALLVLIGAGLANFTSDERAEAILPPETVERLEELEAEAADLRTVAVDPDATAEERQAAQQRTVAIVNDMTSLRATAVSEGTVTLSGFDGDGSKIGRYTLIIGVLGALSTIVAAGFVTADTDRRWIAGATTLGLGGGLVGVAIGWIGTTARATDPNIVSGVGILFLLLAGATLAVAGSSIISDFRRSRVYAVIGEAADPAATSDDETVITAEPAAVGAARN